MVVLAEHSVLDNLKTSKKNGPFQGHFFYFLMIQLMTFVTIPTFFDSITRTSC